MSNFKLVTGRAGTGKSFSMMAKVAEEPEYGILCATTGIAATNLGVTTINSLLKFFDTASLEDKFVEGGVHRIIKRLARDYKYIIIDECSMMDAKQVDIIATAIEQVNGGEGEDSVEDVIDEEIKGKPKNSIGLILVGDAAQLPPVKGVWFFKSEKFKELFQGNINFLTKIWRQDNLGFINALEFARQGEGSELLVHLKELGVGFNPEVDTQFEGTTIFAKNDQVDNYNMVRLMRLVGKDIITKKKTEGKALGEWGKIPENLKLKIGAYVMVLVNKPLGYEDGIAVGFEYSNGDCGYIKEYNPETEVFTVELVRNKALVMIPRITRYNETKHKPDVFTQTPDGFEPYYDDEKKRWVLGWVSFHPLRLAWGITTHKSQGLTLDKVQLDIRNHFFGSNNMLYVALSRARTIEGLRIVGRELLVSKRCNLDPQVEEWFREIEVDKE